MKRKEVGAPSVVVPWGQRKYLARAGKQEQRVERITLNLCNILVSKRSVIYPGTETHIRSTNRHTWSRRLKGKISQAIHTEDVSQVAPPPHMSDNSHFTPQKGPCKKNASSSSIAWSKAAAVCEAAAVSNALYWGNEGGVGLPFQSSRHERNNTLFRLLKLNSHILSSIYRHTRTHTAAFRSYRCIDIFIHTNDIYLQDTVILLWVHNWDRY